MDAPSRPHVVIVGGGFGGLYAAKTLGNKPVRVSLIDRKNHHTFQPLLYQVATAGLSPGEIAMPIRGILSKYRNIEVLLGEVKDVDLKNKILHLPPNELAGDPGERGEIAFDYLILATGASHNYFGHTEWQGLAPGLKTIEDATEIRRRVLLAFELAERYARMERQQNPINFVIVGGGPTGVELAGTLVEIARRVLASDFRHIDPKRARVILVEAGPRVLSAYPEDLSHSAERQLRHLGVEVRVNAMVTNITRDHVEIGTERIPSAVTLWSAGVAASSLGRRLGVPTDRAGRVLVDPDLTIPGYSNVFVIGDLASVKEKNGKPVPGVAPAAIQMGKFAGKTILSDVHGKPRKAFEYWDKGSLATIGRAAAVADLGKIHLSGFLAWLSWLFVHVFFLIGFKNRVLVLLEWAWSYITFQRGARLITGNSDYIVREDQAVAHETRKVS
ncbi:MAG: NAD(P)/FAD-dependent oxidoreductase [Terriglobia bacterium]|nr:NAD(P)/FAD-dependent oxidoreductase [Terriglobia bacterium]